MLTSQITRTLPVLLLAGSLGACAGTGTSVTADDAEATATHGQATLAACPFEQGALPELEHELWTPVLSATEPGAKLDAAETWLHEVREGAINLFADISEEHVEQHAEEQRAFLETWSYGDEALLVVEEGRFTVADRVALALAELALAIDNPRAAAEWVRRSGATQDGDEVMDRCFTALKELEGE